MIRIWGHAVTTAFSQLVVGQVLLLCGPCKQNQSLRICNMKTWIVSSPVKGMLFTLAFITELILRVLYRCTTLAEHTPFSAPTLTYIMPLLSSVIQGERSSQDSSQEQLILTLNLIRLHISKGSADTQTSR